MYRFVIVVSMSVALTIAAASSVVGGCGENCDSTHKSDIESCHLLYGDDPEDADELSSCIQNTRADYRSCLDDCESQVD
jgi:hypothetical protein